VIGQPSRSKLASLARRADRILNRRRGRLALAPRLLIRRLTRLTNAHSKKRENYEAMLGLHFAWYNFCRVRSTIKTTPAVEQGLTGRVWSIEELLTEAATH
jgi:hypothetical protein